MLIFIFVGVLVGASWVFADVEASAGPDLDPDDANVLRVTMEAPIVERGGATSFLSASRRPGAQHARV